MTVGLVGERRWHGQSFSSCLGCVVNFVWGQYAIAVVFTNGSENYEYRASRNSSLIFTDSSRYSIPRCLRNGYQHMMELGVLLRRSSYEYYYLRLSPRCYR